MIRVAVVVVMVMVFHLVLSRSRASDLYSFFPFSSIQIDVYKIFLCPPILLYHDDDGYD